MTPDSPDSEPVEPRRLEYARPDTGRVVAIARFPDEFHAHLAAGKLDADGIDAFVDSVLPLQAMGQRGALLKVHVDDAQASREILRDTPARSHLLPEQPSV